MDVDTFPAVTRPYRDVLRGRSMLVKKTDAAADRMRGARISFGLGPEGLSTDRAPSAASRCRPACEDSSRLPQAIFTPATKAESGHDENITEAAGRRHRRPDLIKRLRELTLEIYDRGVDHAATCGIIIADTKFEFGTRRAEGATARS